MHQNRFPDYFGSRRRTADRTEPADHPKNGLCPTTAYGGGNRGGSIDDIVDNEPFAVHPIESTPARTAAEFLPNRSLLQPNKLIYAAGTQIASKGSPSSASQSTPRQNFQGRFVYREPGCNGQSTTSRPLTPLYHQAPRDHDNADQPFFPQTPWPNRPATRVTRLQQPRYEHGDQGHDDISYQVRQLQNQRVAEPHNTFMNSRSSAVYNGKAYEVQPQPRNLGGPSQLVPTTLRHSSLPRPISAHSSARARPNTAAPRVSGVDLISPRSLDKQFHSIFPYDCFNAVQSSCFTCVYGSSHNTVVAAPTGSGKTVIFELAICRLLAHGDKRAFKIVYLAPTKALCSERARDWQKKFGPLALQVAEFTGDTSAAEVWRARSASIIVTTPEKWDSTTRKWSDHGTLLKTVKLVLIDEVHILKDMRGSTLETVVSRMKTLGNEVRFVALSATIPNSTDIAQWLGLSYANPQISAKSFVFGEEFRPVRLEKIVLGYNTSGGNEHSFDSVLDDQLADLIVNHSKGKPVLIFCFTRKSSESAAMVLADFWAMCAKDQKPWPDPSVTVRSNAPRLQAIMESGVAFHHGGLERQDRDSVEDAFLRGHLSVVCCTSTLAMGVNLPCHTVILKGTTGYQSGKFSEYDEFEVVQMVGRAGRPQFDSSATAIILTRIENREKYMSIESGRQAVESMLHMNLIEHLNSEIVLGTVSSLSTAVLWLKGTFLAVRLRQNPNHYQLTGENIPAKRTDSILEDICKTGIQRLAVAGLLTYVDYSDGIKFRNTQYGSAMSTYMIRFETMVMILALPKTITMEKLLNSLCHASEFNECCIKSTERPALRELNKTQDIPFKFKENIVYTWQKISVLIQVELARGALPYQSRMAIEARQSMKCMQRLLESYIACAIADNNGHGTKIGLELSRSMTARAWEGHHAQLCQVPDIGPANMKKLVDKQIKTVLDLADLGIVNIERLLTKNPPAAMKIADVLRSFPRLMVDGDIAIAERAESSSSSNDTNSSPTEPKAVATITFGIANAGGVPRWRNKVPTATLLAVTAGGSLLHIWRGRLQDKQHKISFPVLPDNASCVICYFTCDEIVGTVQSRTLACKNVSYTEISGWITPNVPTKKRTQRTQVEPNPPKKQKPQHNASHHLLVENGDVDFVDLSLSDGEKDRNILETQWGGDRQNSFAFHSLLQHHLKHCSGEGTQEDPFTLHDSESEDFDTDIFDDVELLAINEPFQEKQPIPLTDGSFEGEDPLTHLPDIGKQATVTLREIGLVIPQTTPEDDGPQVEETRREQGPPGNLLEFEACADLDSQRSCDEQERGGEQMWPRGESDMGGHKIMETQKLNEEGERKVAPILTADPKKEAEPTWVNTSSSSVVDFLRGHVKFV